MENEHQERLDAFLKKQVGVKQVNRLGYVFVYKDVWCYGGVTLTPWCDCLTIKPMNVRDKITDRAGEGVYLTFETQLLTKEEIKEQPNDT